MESRGVSGTLPDLSPNCSAFVMNGTSAGVSYGIWGEHPGSNTVFWLIVASIVTLIWKRCARSEKVQKMIHKLPNKQTHVLLQWYTVFAIFMVFMFFREALNVAWITWNPSGIAHQLLALHPDKLSWQIAMYLSWCGPFMAFGGFVLCLWHCRQVVVRGFRRRRTSTKLPWQSSARQEMVLVLIAMPVILMLMSVKSTVRMWYQLSGQDKNWYACYDEVWYTINLQVSSIWGYMMIFVFSKLMNTIISTHIVDEGVRWAVQWTSFQGTWAFVLVGVVQGVLEVWNGSLLLDPDRLGATAVIVKKGRDTMKAFATVFMVLCIYNMFVLCKVPVVKAALGNASLKFLATRSILLIIQYQPIVLDFLVDPDDFFSLSPVESIVQGSFLAVIRDALGLTKTTAKLYNSALLCMEGFWVVVFNVWAWERDATESNLMADEFGIEIAEMDELIRSQTDSKEIRMKSAPTVQGRMHALQTPLMASS